MHRPDPPYAALPSPRSAGKTWRTYVRAYDPEGGRLNRVRIDGEVLGRERVRVPAGEFHTLKVRREAYAGNAAYFESEKNITECEWYAPVPGVAVRRCAYTLHHDNSRNCRGQWIVVRGDWVVIKFAALAGVR